MNFREVGSVTGVRQLIPIPQGDAGPLDDDAMAALVGSESRHGAGAWVMSNMVASLDGAISVDGRSAPLGGDGDRTMFGALRAQADVIVAGAGTMRAEGYRMPRVATGILAEQRRERGQSPAPALAVVSRSLDLAGVPFLDDADPSRCIVVTTSDAPSDRRRELTRRCTIIEAGQQHVDLTAAVATIAALGHHVMLCEGGPRLLSDLIAADLVDEWNATISPLVVGDAGPRMIVGQPARRALVLDRLIADGSHLLARYLFEAHHDEVASRR